MNIRFENLLLIIVIFIVTVLYYSARITNKRTESSIFTRKGLKQLTEDIYTDVEHLEILNSTKVEDLLIKFMNESLNRVLLRVNNEISESKKLNAVSTTNYIKDNPSVLYEYLTKAIINDSVPILRGGICGSIEKKTNKHGVKCGLTNQLFETINCFRLLTEWRNVHVGDFLKQIDFIVEVPSCWDGAWGLCFEMKQCYSISHFFSMEKVAKRLKDEFSIVLLDRMEYLELECKKKVLIDNLPNIYKEWIFRLKHNLFKSKNDYLRLLRKALQLGLSNNDSSLGNKRWTIYKDLVDCKEILYHREQRVDEKYIKHLDTSQLLSTPVNEAYWPEPNILTIGK